jgi:hypothetical protein
LSISEVRISLVRANAFRTPEMSAQSAPPAAPHTHIARIVKMSAWSGPSQIAIPEAQSAPR